MPFATLGARPNVGETAVGRSRAALGREVARRTTSVLAEIDALTESLAAGRPVTATEVLHTAARIDALRTTIAYRELLGGAA